MNGWATRSDLRESRSDGPAPIQKSPQTVFNKTSLNRAVVQVAGSASVLEADVFCEFAEGSVTFRATLARHEQFILAQAQQSAACNACHRL